MIDVHLHPHDIRRGLEEDVRRGFTTQPKIMSPKWFYDDRGSELFDEITRLAEYYPTSRERSILRARACEIMRLAGCDTLIELGSGTSDKTRLLLDAGVRTQQLQRFIPFDVSEATLRWAAAVIGDDYPSLEVDGVVGDFERHLPLLPRGGRRMVAFLGGTIGNLYGESRARFFRDLASTLEPGDTLLLGTDLVKDVGRLLLAYDDPQGVTAEFNRNVLHVINRELIADFEPDAFAHEARWNVDEEWIEMHLVARGRQRVFIRDLDLTVEFAPDESVRTEVSAKFTRARVERELAAAGFDLVEWMTDPANDFAVSLSTCR